MKLGLINGIHEDIIRLNEALALLDTHSCDRIACLGDLVGYSVPYYGYLASRNAHQVIDIVSKHCDYVVAGNHDLYAVKRLPQHQNIFEYPQNWYSLDYFSRKELSQGKVHLYDDELPAHLSRSDEEYLKSLPEFIVVTLDHRNFMFSHYAYPDLVGDSRTFDPAKDNNIGQHFTFMREHGCQIGISGHDLNDGARIYTQTRTIDLSFGTYTLSNELTWFHGLWVANGTCENGVMILDTGTLELTILPLNTPKHIVPTWSAL